MKTEVSLYFFNSRLNLSIKILFSITLMLSSSICFSMTCSDAFGSSTDNASAEANDLQVKLAKNAIAELIMAEKTLAQYVVDNGINSVVPIDEEVGQQLLTYSQLIGEFSDGEDNYAYISLFNKLAFVLLGEISIKSYTRMPEFRRRHPEVIEAQVWHRYPTSAGYKELSPGLLMLRDIEMSEFANGLGLREGTAKAVYATLLQNKIGKELRSRDLNQSLGSVETYNFEFISQINRNNMVQVLGVEVFNKKTEESHLVLKNIRKLSLDREVSFYHEVATQEGFEHLQISASVMGKVGVVIIPARVLYKAQFKHNIQADDIVNWIKQGEFQSVYKNEKDGRWESSFTHSKGVVRAYFSEDLSGDLLLRSIFVGN